MTYADYPDTAKNNAKKALNTRRTTVLRVERVSVG
jgi:hypothetical protein